MNSPEEQALTTKAPQGIMVEFGEKLGLDPRVLGRTLVSTIFPRGDATNEQVYALLLVAKRYDLDPMTKQIYAFPAKGGGVTPIVGYDGMCVVANRHPQMDGVESEWIKDEKGKVIGCRAAVWRKDRTRPTVVEELIAECKQDRSPVWQKHPTRMIRNRAITQAFRLAFSLVGIYLPDEAEQIRDAEFQVNDYAPSLSKAAQELEDKLNETEEPHVVPVESVTVELDPTPAIELDENGQALPPLEQL